MYILGIDIGSTFSKAVILQGGAILAAHVVKPLGTGTVGPGRTLKEVFELCGSSQQGISYTVATGYGWMNCDCADEQISELDCHARGIYFLSPTVHTVIDTGGQGTKALSITDEGRLTTFQTNDECAVGMGRLLDIMTQVLNVGINELGPLSQKFSHPVSIGNTYTVFAESGVIPQLSSNIPVEDIAMGIHSSMTRRIAGMSLRLDRTFDMAMSGGIALNTDVAHTMEQGMGCHILVDPLCQSVGAIGTAVLTWEKRRKGEVDNHK